MKYSKEMIFNKNGNDVIAYTITNDKGLAIEILNLGGIITKILAPNKDGKFENVVLSFKNKKDYIENPTYMGAIIGRTAGRIYDGKIEISGIDYQLNKNYDPHNGHGGNIGFDKKIWESKIVEETDNLTLELRLKSKDKEEYYPGDLDVIVRYKINNDNELKIEYEAISNKDTLVNMTNHSYFNLSGNIKRPVVDNRIKVNSDYILEIDESQGTTGKIKEVSNTPFDFRTKKIIGDYIDSDDEQIRIGKGYNHPWILNNDQSENLLLEDIESGRTLSMTTTEPCVVIYTMNYENELILENNKYGQVRYGICFETQRPPIGKDMCFLEQSILKKGAKYKQETIFKFGLIK